MRYWLCALLAISSLALSGLGWGQDGRNCHIEHWNGSVAIEPYIPGWTVAQDLRIVCEPVATIGFGGGDFVHEPKTGKLVSCLGELDAHKKSICHEPMDVPAINVPVQQCVLPNSGMNVNSSFSCTMTAGSSCPCGHYETIQEATCPKGSGRVLLTDIDQGKHCILFPKEKQ